MELATKEQIKHAADAEYAVVAVPNWGNVRFMTLDIIQRLDFLKKWSAADPEQAVYLLRDLVLQTAVDGDGKRLFDDSDGEWLIRKGWASIKHAADELLALNGLSDKSVKEREKNSETTQS